MTAGLALGLLILACQAQTTHAVPNADMAMQALRLAPGEGPPLDGTLNHPAWQRAPVYDRFTEKEPVNGAVPVYKTEVRMLYDDKALFVGINALDPQPELISAPLVRHDGVNRTQDFVVLYVDATGQGAGAQFFRVNASGSTADGMHTHADDNEDFAPDFDFDAATARHAGGWTAVLRIPFSSLRYPSGGGQDWRVMVARRVPRDQFHLVTSVPIPRGSPSFVSTLQALQGLQPPQNQGFLSLRPSLTLRRLTQTDGGLQRTRESDAHASLDLKWRPWAELVVDATFNPDFSQVALDRPQLRGNTLFALELDEKRPFFFESSDLLRAPGGNLYTRSFTEPRLGARATWRGERVAATAFAVDDRGGGSVILPGAYASGLAQQPASHTLVARLQGDAPAWGRTQWGLLAMQRDYLGTDGRDLGNNRVLGPDLAWQIDADWRLRAQWLGSSTSAQPLGDTLGPAPARHGQRRFLSLIRTVHGSRTELSVDDLDADFRHDAGFVTQTGARSVDFHQGWGWFDRKPFNEIWANLYVYQARERGSGIVQQEFVTPGLFITAPGNLEWTLQWRNYSRLRADASAPLLSERYWRNQLSLSVAPWWPALETELNLGKMADLGAGGGGRVREGGRGRVTLRLRPLPALELEPEVNEAWFREGGQTVYRESTPQLLAVWHFNARHSLRMIAQHSSLFRDGQRQVGDGSLSLTYGWRSSAGSMLYVGATRQRQFDPAKRGTEVYFKWQMDVDDWRQGRLRW